MPRPNTSVATMIRFLKLLNISNLLMRSGYGTPEWMQSDGKDALINSLLRASALAVDLTKMIT
jgi:hypothetical protein